MAAQRRTDVGTSKRRREILPHWDMPSDPVKGILWFLHWSLKVSVRFCWLPILLMVIYEGYLNWHTANSISSAIVAGAITLVIGLGIWAALLVVLVLLDVSEIISHAFSAITQLEQRANPRSRRSPFAGSYEENIVEGTITDLEEERKKRRRE